MLLALLGLATAAAGCNADGVLDAGVPARSDLAVPSPEDLAIPTGPDPDLAIGEDLADPVDLAPRPDLRIKPLALSFAPVVAYATDPVPAGIVAVDLNRDTHVDLAVTTRDRGGLMVFLGDGKGAFGAPVTYATGGWSDAVVSGDFDGDGNIDLCTSTNIPTGLRVLLGHGDGTFDVSANFPAPNDAYGLAVGDFNRDQKLDVAMIGSIAGGVFVYLGAGDGTLGPCKQLGRNLGTEHLAAGDMDGDGILDLVVPTSGFTRELLVMKGDGKGFFAEVGNYPIGYSPRGVVVADLDGNKTRDVVVSQLSDNPPDIRVLLGTGKGNLAPAVPYLTKGHSPEDLTVADFNNDRVPDVAVATGPDSVEVLIGLGDGSFVQLGSYVCGSSPRSMAAADLNHDGLVDLAVTVRGADKLAVLINTSR